MSTAFCRGCGKEVDNAVPTCPHCGAAQEGMQEQVTGTALSPKRKMSVRLKIGIGIIIAIAVYLPYGIYVYHTSDKLLKEHIAMLERFQRSSIPGSIIYTRELHAAKNSFGLFNLVNHFNSSAGEAIAKAVTGWSRSEAEQTDRRLERNARDLERQERDIERRERELKNPSR